MSDPENKVGAMPAARAFVLRTAPKVAALRASIAIAIRWFGPFGLVITGMFMMLVSMAKGEPILFLAIFGGLMILSGMDGYAERGKFAERERWSKFFADMIASDTETTFRVEHTFESLRPRLDQVVAEIVARQDAPEGGSHV